MIKLTIYSIIHWINDIDKVEYLFLGDAPQNIKSIITKLHNKERIKDDDMLLLKSHYTNLSYLLKRITKNPELIWKSIYNDDTLYTLKVKLTTYLFKNLINHKHIYMWYSKKINNYHLLDLLFKIFTNSVLNSNDFNIISKRVFNTEYNHINKIVDFKTVYDEYIDNVSYIHDNLEIRYFDKFSHQRFLFNNPYIHGIYNEFLTDNDEFNSKWTYNLDSLNLIKNKIQDNNVYVINITTTQELYNHYIKEYSDKEVINGIIRVYMPFIENIKDINVVENKKDYITEVDKIINSVYQVQYPDDDLVTSTKIYNLHLRLYPILINPNYGKSIFNLETVFNTFETSENIPIIIYKTKEDNIYKINKDSIGENPKNKIRLDKHDLFTFTYSDNITRRTEFLLMHIYFKNYEQYSKFFTFIIFETGEIDLVYDFKVAEVVNIREIIKSFTSVNEVIDKINNTYKVHMNKTMMKYTLLHFSKELLNADVNFLKVENWSTLNTIEFYKEKNMNIQAFAKTLANAYPIFDFIKKDNNIIYLKYKRVINYLNLDPSAKYIRDNINESIEDITNFLVDNMGHSQNTAELKYYEVVNLLKLVSVDYENAYTYEMNDVLIQLIMTTDIKTTFTIQGELNDKSNQMIMIILKSLIYNKQLLNYNIKANEKKQNDTVFTNTINELLEQQFKYKNNDNLTLNNDQLDLSYLDKDVDDDDDDLDLDIDIIDILSDEEDNDIQEKHVAKVDIPVNNIVKSYTDINELFNVEDDNTDDITEEDFNDNKNRYFHLILNRLQKADKQLFDYNPKKYPGYDVFSKKCQAAHRKQPIVINEEEKNIIDTHYRKSYTNYMKTGSTLDKREQFYYICPRIWCPVSKVSITESDLVNVNNALVCPIHNEEPMILDHPYWFKKGQPVKRYVMSLKKGHPEGYSLPCCGKNKRQDIVDDFRFILENNDDIEDEVVETTEVVEVEKIRYISNRIKLPAEPNRYAVLPNKLSKLLDNDTQCQIINYTTDCFVRRGIKNVTKQSFLMCMIYLMNNPNIKSLADFNREVENNMTPLDYIELNNGNTLKLYLNNSPEASIYIAENFMQFKTWFLNPKQQNYIDKMDMSKTVDYIKDMTSFTYDNNYNFDTILREYMIYNSFTNFKKYLNSNLIKTHEELLQLFTNHNNSWLNPNRYNITILQSSFPITRVDIASIKKRDRRTKKLLTEIKEKGVEQIKGADIYSNDTIHIMCSKFTNYGKSMNLLNEFVFVVLYEHTQTYEPVVNVTMKKDTVNEKSTFNYFHEKRLKRIIDIQRTECNIENVKEILTPVELYKILNTLEFKVKKVILNMSFKVAGFLLHSNLFIPLENAIYSSNILAIVEEKFNFMYLHELYKYKCELKQETILNIFKLIHSNILINKIRTQFYNLAEFNFVKNPKSKTKNMLLTFGNVIIPLYLMKEQRESIIDMINDKFIFIGVNRDYDKSPMNAFITQYDKKEDNYVHILKTLVKLLINNDVEYNRLKYLRHPFNPFPTHVKINKIYEIILTLNKDTKFDITNILDKLITDIYIKNLEYIININDSKLNINPNEVVMDQNDVNEGKLRNLYVLLSNPYKFIENSIEDYISYSTVVIDSKTANITKLKFLSSQFDTSIIPKLWINVFDIFEVNINPDNNITKYFLEIFNRISILSNNKLVKTQIKSIINKSYEDNYKKDKTTFIEENLLNKYFYLKYREIGDEQNILDIFNESEYTYSFYELKLLANMMNINIIVIGNKNEHVIPNGMHYIDGNSKNWLIFLVEFREIYDHYHIMMIDRDKFIFTEDDFSKDILKFIDKYTLK